MFPQSLLLSAPYTPSFLKDACWFRICFPKESVFKREIARANGEGVFESEDEIWKWLGCFDCSVYMKEESGG